MRPSLLHWPFSTVLAATAWLCTACPSPEPVENHSVCATDPAFAGAAWEVVVDTDALGGALFSIWGSSAQDVWAVGATNKDKPDFGAQVLRWDGKVWKRLKSGVQGELWWVTRGFPAGTVWIAGSKGTILRSDGKSFEVQQTPDKTQLFGIYAFSEQDVYAVGGNAQCTPGIACGTIWHFDGKTWSQPAGLTGALMGKATWFKTWGRNAKDLWVVGSSSEILHFDGTTWSETPVPAPDQQIFTVHGNDTLTVAVGGFGAGVVFENAGTGWKVAKVSGVMPGLRGVFVPADGRAVAVGENGSVWRRCGGLWTQETAAPEALLDFHAVWKAASGELFAVGGAINAPPYAGGQIVHFGVKTNVHTIGE
jgi:hypothetical protein